MVARQYRLRSPNEFERIRSSGKNWPGRLVVAIVLANELGSNRYGFAVGRRVGSAAARNRAKRLMRESVRKLHPRTIQGFDIVFIARNRVRRDTSQQEIDNAIETVLRRAKVLDLEPKTSSSPGSETDLNSSGNVSSGVT